jgi:hypothetical protein
MFHAQPLTHLQHYITLATDFFFFIFDGASARSQATISPISFLESSLFAAAAFQFRICSKSMASLQTAPPIDL